MCPRAGCWWRAYCPAGSWTGWKAKTQQTGQSGTTSSRPWRLVLAFVQSEETSEGSHVVARVTEKASNACTVYCTFSIFKLLNSSCRWGRGWGWGVIKSRSSGKVWEWCVYSCVSIFILHLQTWFNLVTELEMMPFVYPAWGRHFKTTTNETSGFFPCRYSTCDTVWI